MGTQCKNEYSAYNKSMERIYTTVLKRIMRRRYPWCNHQRGVNDEDGGGGRKKNRNLDYNTL
jgi:hypothetical protein